MEGQVMEGQVKDRQVKEGQGSHWAEVDTEDTQRSFVYKEACKF